VLASFFCLCATSALAQELSFKTRIDIPKSGGDQVALTARRVSEHVEVASAARTFQVGPFVVMLADGDETQYSDRTRIYKSALYVCRDQDGTDCDRWLVSQRAFRSGPSFIGKVQLTLSHDGADEVASIDRFPLFSDPDSDGELLMEVDGRSVTDAVPAEAVLEGGPLPVRFWRALDADRGLGLDVTVKALAVQPGFDGVWNRVSFDPEDTCVRQPCVIGKQVPTIATIQLSPRIFRLPWQSVMAPRGAIQIASSRVVVGYVLSGVSKYPRTAVFVLPVIFVPGVIILAIALIVSTVLGSVVVLAKRGTATWSGRFLWIGVAVCVALVIEIIIQAAHTNSSAPFTIGGFTVPDSHGLLPIVMVGILSGLFGPKAIELIPGVGVIGGD